MNRGLPVLRTCSGCAFCHEVRSDHYRGGETLCAREDRSTRRDDPPPDWCPLPRAEPDRELLREVVCAAIATPPPTSADAIIDAVLAARRQR